MAPQLLRSLVPDVLSLSYNVYNQKEEEEVEERLLETENFSRMKK